MSSEAVFPSGHAATSAATGTRTCRALLAAEAIAAPQARRMLRDLLVGSPLEPRLDDALLALTEVVGNAVLHGREPIRLALILTGDLLRVEVQDGSAVSPAFSMLDPTAVTGRGLMLVSSVADAWGVEPGSTGKTVWFSMSATPPGDDTEAVEEARLLESWAEGLDVDPAHEDVRVVVTDVDTGALAAAEAHNDGLLRELALVASEARDHDLQARAASVLSRCQPLDALRAEVRRQLTTARLQGRPRIDVLLTVRREDAETVRDFMHALDDAERMCRSEELLMVPADPGVSDARRVFLRRVLDQLRS